jgi:hypothetical protein
MPFCISVSFQLFYVWCLCVIRLEAPSIRDLRDSLQQLEGNNVLVTH